MQRIQQLCKDNNITDGSGNCIIKIQIAMNKHGFDNNGIPNNYIDENGIYWKYHGKGSDGGDEWFGGQETNLRKPY